VGNSGKKREIVGVIVGRKKILANREFVLTLFNVP
jgi:hypothetical protein